MEPLPETVRAAAAERMAARGVHGVAICGFDVEGVRFAGGLGMADLARCEPVTPATVFRVASISKLLTTTLALRLVDDGLLDLDAPVNDGLAPELRIVDREGGPASSPLRTLLSHTSGLPAGVSGIDLGNPVLSRLANGRRIDTLADAVTGLRLVRGPGERIVYSNPAFNVVGHVAAVASGRSFEDAALERVLAPMGMEASAFATDRRGPGVATPYGRILPPAVSSTPADSMRLLATPMGGLTTTVLDLARFGRMVLGGGVLDGERILGPEVLRAATSLEATNHRGLDQGYGLGFKVRPWRGRTVIGHDGNMPGVSTQLVLSPADGVGVVVLTNAFALAVPHEVAAIALAHLVGASDQEEAGAPEQAPAGNAAWTDLARSIEGSYRLQDVLPPGIVGTLTGILQPVKVVHEERGRLRVEGNPGADGPMWLHPDGEVGRYRVEAGVDDGTSAMVDEQADGVHLWIGHTTHLHRRRR